MGPKDDQAESKHEAKVEPKPDTKSEAPETKPNGKDDLKTLPNMGLTRLKKRKSIRS
jgi:hypothetical protein